MERNTTERERERRERESLVRPTAVQLILEDTLSFYLILVIVHDGADSSAALWNQTHDSQSSLLSPLSRLKPTYMHGLEYLAAVGPEK